MQGKVYYYFSIQHNDTNPPSPYEEHQVCFFESHFTKLKYGLIDGEKGASDYRLQWMVQGQGKWSTNFTAGVWHNVAYAIDFDAGTVGFYHSTGSDDLKLIVSPVAVSAASNAEDWHLGVLRLASITGRTDSVLEGWHFSGVYIESGDITTSVTGSAGNSTAIPSRRRKHSK
jgi:Glycoside hydrolase 131 catalytic N-terminal domain